MAVLVVGALMKQLKSGTLCDRYTELSGHSNLKALITCLYQTTIYLVAACFSSPLYCHSQEDRDVFVLSPDVPPVPSTMPGTK